MGWWSRLRPPRASERPTRGQRREREHDLTEWVAARRGVEVYVEPATAVTQVSMVLVAADGEFTRRRIESPAAAQAFAHGLRLPVYDATVVGYPQRMRDYSRRRTILDRRSRGDGDAAAPSGR